MIEALLDNTPIYIMRRDIKSFYESVPVEPLKDLLLFDTGSSVRVRDYLRRFFELHCPQGEGLPRGIGLSALLAELYMKDFDQKVRSFECVYKYYRFSDDIIIFSYAPIADIDEKLRAALSDSMQINTKKSADVQLAEQNKTNSRFVSFEYLGYSFRANTFLETKSNESRRVEVTISPRKISKLKSRVIIALKSFQKTGDFSLLRDRIYYVTSNYTVRRNGFAMTGGATHVKSGIFYNYKQCGVYKYKNFQMNREEASGSEIKGLDGFLYGLIKGNKSEFRARLQSLSPIQRRTLQSASFNKGFSKRMTVRFRPDRISQIKSVWLHV